MTGIAACNLLPLTVLLVVWESWTSTGTIRRWRMSRCPALSQLTGPTPTAPTCCWTYGTVTNTTAATSSAVCCKNMNLRHQASYTNIYCCFNHLSLLQHTVSPSPHYLEQWTPTPKKCWNMYPSKQTTQNIYLSWFFRHCFHVTKSMSRLVETQFQMTTDLSELNPTNCVEKCGREDHHCVWWGWENSQPGSHHHVWTRIWESVYAVWR